MDDDALVDALAQPWKGDLDGVLKRGFLRVGTIFNPVLFSYDGADQRGIVVDVTQELQKHLRATLGDPATNLTIVLAPLPRDRLVPALEEGLIDVIIGDLIVTPSRAERVDFTEPLASGVREVVVTGPSAPAIGSLDDLAAITLRLRPSSSFYEHIVELNAKRKAAGPPEIPVEPLNENMEDNDLLELVAAGTFPAAVVDRYMGKLYARIIDDLTVREDLVVFEGGEIAWMVRKKSPDLVGVLNGFIARAAKGTMLGNMLINRYFKDTKRVENAMAPAASQRVREIRSIVARHAKEYQFDEILILAQGFQESGLDNAKRSHVGAVGVMQVMPATATDPIVGVPNFHELEPNIRAGIKSLRWLRDQYFSDPAISDLDQTLFSFAAYNAGPGNIAKARQRATKMGLDPNVWFGSVELATAKVVSREPVVYVRNILKYYVTYQVYADRLGDKPK